MQVLAAFEQNRTSRIVLQHLIHRRAEMVMQRCSLPHAHVTPAFLIIFIYLCLQDYTHALHEEDAAKNRDHQLLMDHHGADTDDAADGQTARIAKEHLCRETVKPQITHQSTHKSSQKDY